MNSNHLNITYYRPVWTCGRFNEEAEVAIYYNLIAGMSYYFESYSAKVIGKILETPKNGSLNLEDISQDLNISMGSLIPFFQQLEQNGIVSSIEITDDVIADYRHRVSEYHCKQEAQTERTIQEKLPYAVSNAEQAYTEKAASPDKKRSCFYDSPARVRVLIFHCPFSRTSCTR